MDIDIRQCAEIITSLKGEMNGGRSIIAHPPVSDTQITEFLKRIGEDLETSNVDLFKYLKSTANTPENIKNAAARGG
jgi:hypothetical protein